VMDPESKKLDPEGDHQLRSSYSARMRECMEELGKDPKEVKSILDVVGVGRRGARGRGGRRGGRRRGVGGRGSERGGGLAEPLERVQEEEGGRICPHRCTRTLTLSHYALAFR
jgi:hypothetical protein